MSDVTITSKSYFAGSTYLLRRSLGIPRVMNAVDKCIKFLNKVVQHELYMHRNTLISQLHKKTG